MSGCADALGISDSAFALLRDLIEQRLGVFYDNGKRDILADRLSQITSSHGMQSYLDYYYALKYDENADRYWSDLMDHLTVPETYFWRQAEHLKAVVDYIVPEQLTRRKAQTLRIWSAACCSGEEPFSIAMALTEAGAYERLNVEIVASDASPAMIAKAQKGIYGERAFRSLSPDRRERFFTQENGGWRINDDLRRRVDFRVINLLEAAETAALKAVDVAFCRNVLIYFSDPAIARAADVLSRTVRPGGRVFLGAAETFTRVKSNFILTEMGDTLVYVNNG